MHSLPHHFRLQFLAVAVLAFLLAAPGFTEKLFYTRGEPREALVSQAMFSSGDWILPEGYGGDVPSKPPVTHWMTTLFSIPAGDVTETTARLPSQFAYVLFLPLYFLFVARRIGSSEAFLATLLLMTSAEWFRAGTTARVDMVLTAAMAGGLLAAYRWYERGMQGAPVLAWILFAVATLTKGPVGVVLPGLIWGVFLLAQRVALRRIVGSGVRLFLVPTLPYAAWSYAALLDRGGDFISKIYEENIARFAHTMHDEPHKRSAIALYGTLLIGILPWSVMLLGSLASYAKPRGVFNRIQQWWRTLGSFHRYCCVVVLVVLFFFSIPVSKRSVYLLPLYPFLVVGIVSQLRVLQQRSPTVILWCVRGLSALVLLIICLLATSSSWQSGVVRLLRHEGTAFDLSFFLQAVRGYTPHLRVFDWALLATLLSSCLLCFAPQLRGMLIRSFGLPLVLLVYLTANETLVPAATTSLSEQPFAERIAERVRGNALWSFGDEFYGTSFYLKQRINRAEESAQPDPGFYVLFEENLVLFQSLLRAQHRSVILHRSEFGVIKPRNRALLVEVYDPVTRQEGAETTAN